MANRIVTTLLVPDAIEATLVPTVKSPGSFVLPSAVVAVIDVLVSAGSARIEYVKTVVWGPLASVRWP